MRWIDSNPFEKLFRKKAPKINITAREKDDPRNAFSRPEIEKIFNHITFTNHREAQACYRKVTREKLSLKAYHYWAPLIGLYTGARPCEISALYLDDIIEYHGVCSFDFNGTSDDKCSKTYNAIRLTPIHSHLIELGLPCYIETLKKAGEIRLFPELRHTNHDGYARYVNEHFSKYILMPLKIYKKDRKVFYSFRHTVTTELQEKGCDAYYREWLTGRSIPNKNTGDKHYVHKSEIDSLRKKIHLLDYSKELSKVVQYC